MADSSQKRRTIGREPRVLVARVPALPHDPGGAPRHLDQREPRVGAAHVTGEHDHGAVSRAVSRAAAVRSSSQTPRRASRAGTAFGVTASSTARATIAALSSPVAITPTARAASITGGVIVRRSAGVGADHGDHPAVALVQRGRSRKQRGGVAIRPHAEEQDVKRLREDALVLQGGGIPIATLGLHAVNLPGGDGHPGEQGQAHHAVVALGIIGRDRTLVAEEHVHPLQAMRASVASARYTGSGVRPPARPSAHEPRAAMAPATSRASQSAAWRASSAGEDATISSVTLRS